MKLNKATQVSLTFNGDEATTLCRLLFHLETHNNLSRAEREFVRELFHYVPMEWHPRDREPS